MLSETTRRESSSQLSIWGGYLKEQEVRYVWENGTGVVARDDSQVDVLWMSACL